jgi:hypothetical protein
MTDMLKNEAIKGPTPKRSKRVLAGAALGVLLLAGGSFFGIRAANDYRSEIAAMEASAAAYYDAAEEQQQLAADAAERAQSAAEDASESVASLEAAEAEAAAEAAAAEAAAASNVSKGLTPDGKCPAGTVAGEVHDDGTEGLCAPTGPGGQPCAEYTGDVCTAWLKP